MSAHRQRIPAHITDQLAEHGLRQLHDWPLASHGRIDGQAFEPPTRPGITEAWSWPYIELQPPLDATCIVLDVDHADELEIPRPSWIVTSNATNHRHVVYVLEHPVHRGSKARTAPLMFYRRAAEGLRRLAGADACSTGSVGVMQLVRNPVAPGPDCSTIWMRQTPFTLGELREWIPEPLITLRSQRPQGHGRNVDVFTWARSEALRGTWPRTLAEDGPTSPAWEDEVRRYALELSPEAPLPASEVRSIARSSARYAVENWRPDWRTRRLPQLQARRGRKAGHASGASRRAPNIERDQRIIEAAAHGISQRQIARNENLSQGGVIHILKRAAGELRTRNRMFPAPHS